MSAWFGFVASRWRGGASIAARNSGGLSQMAAVDAAASWL